MNSVLIILAILLFVLQTLSLKLIRAETLSEKLLSNFLFTLLAAAAMGVLTILFPGFRGISAGTLVCGCLFGLMFSLTILFYLSAISCGPLSYTSFYLSASMLLPACAGLLFFKEAFSPSLLIALFFFLAAFYLLNVTGEDQKADKKWLVFCILTFLCNSSSGIIQKTQQLLSGGTEAVGMMMAGFCAASLCYGTAYLCTPSRVRVMSVLSRNVIPVCLLAAASLGGNLLLTYLSGINDGSYLFPLVQGSIILGVTVCSVLFFHEKLTLRGKLGILAGTVGIIIINL